MNRPTSHVVACCLALGVAEYALYHVNFHQFFQGDAIFWMYYRFQGIGEFLRAFVTLDVAHWYRPLSNRVIPSLLYPILGLRPYGYHLVFFACFFVTTCTVLLFLEQLTGKLSAAFFGAFFFSIHSIDIYTSYDFAFTPEVFLVFFYVATVGALLKSEQDRSVKWRRISLLCFVLTLMSKEASATLPALLFLAHVFYIREGLFSAVRAIGAHIGIWLAYLVYVVWYLGVGGGDYMLILNTNIPRNLLSGIYFALNLRQDGFMPTRAAPIYVFAFLVGFAIMLLLVGLQLLATRERRHVAFGVLWFGIAFSPMLMLNTIGPYYLFLSLVGVALIVGVSLQYVYDLLSKPSPWLAGGAIAGVLAMFWISTHSVMAADRDGDIALGLASRWGKNSIEDVMAVRSQLRPGSRIYIFNDSMPDLWRIHGMGNLFKLLYQDESITTAFRTLAQGPKAPETGELLVMKTEGERLIDVTEANRQDPKKFMNGIDDSGYIYATPRGVTLSVAPTEVTAGRDFYWLTTTSLGSDVVVVQYTLNDGPVAEAQLKLNPEGKVRFFLTAFTQTGDYHFIRFRSITSPKTEWIKADARLRVLPPQR